MPNHIQLPNELTVLRDIGDHAYALCHRENAAQVEQQNIENLLLVIDPTGTLSISREGDPSSGKYPSGWVMLLDDESAVQIALKELQHSFA